MSPYQHGEVYVTEDGAETDLDLGHYERFIDEDLNKYSNLTTGKVYANVLRKERQGGYLGRTVQTIPHITDEIKRFIYRVGERSDADIVITEIGGTIGDIESQPFLEAIRQFQAEVGRENAIMIQVTLIPYLKASGEMKTKPTQMSVKSLQSMGIWPDILVCRSDYPVDDHMREKIALFCNVKKEHVLQNLDAQSLYEVPLLLEKEKLAQAVLECLHLPCPVPDLKDWEQMVRDLHNPQHTVQIGLVGKYVSLHDAYLSVAEALKHAGTAHRTEVKIRWIDAEEVTEETADDLLKDLQGILVPGGFGSRGIEGKITAIRYARTHGIPFLGLCLGMQLSIIEFARGVLGYADASSTELNEETAHPMIHLMPDQEGVVDLGGTLRLGAYPCVLQKGTKAYALYGCT
jgi:CTP synthase